MICHLDFPADTRTAIVDFLQAHSLTIVVAALNERDNLKPFCVAVERLFHDYGFECAVVIVDDGSCDGSPALLQDLCYTYQFLRVVYHPTRRGLTGVLQTASQSVASDWLYLTAADLESDIYTDLPRLMAAYQPGDAAVAGWRQGRGDHKKLASAIANWWCRLGFGLNIHDMNWVKLVQRAPMAALPLPLVTHRYIMAILAGLGYRIREVPVTWHARKAGKSKFGRRRLVSSAWEFTQLWLWFQLRGRWVLPHAFKRPLP